MLVNKKDIEKISNQLQDDISRTIYANRLLFSQTGDNGYLRNVCETIKETREFIQWIDDNSCRELILFGAGKWGKWIKETFDNYDWKYFADNKVKEVTIEGLKVITTEELLKSHQDSAIVITPKFYNNEIYNQLKQNGFDDIQLYNLGKAITDIESRIYFDLPWLPREQHEIFVDAGGFDGTTSLAFTRWCTNDYKIKVFEPDEKSFENCRNTLQHTTDFEVIPKGLWDKETCLSFISNGSESRIVEDSKGKNRVPVTTLDDALHRQKVTFIKMDIEGAELKALQGASDTIKEYKPKMAISIYHKPEDIIELPKLLLAYNPNYKFWLRHYSMTWFDTVLYAI